MPFFVGTVEGLATITKILLKNHNTYAQLSSHPGMGVLFIHGTNFN